MNELSLFDEVVEKTVTTKELAETLGVEVSSVKRAVQKLGAVLHSVKKNSQGGYLFTEEQATLIKQEIQGHHNLASRQIDSVSTDYEMELLTQKVINYHVQKAAEYKQRAEIAEQKLLEQKPMVDGYKMFLASHGSFDMQKTAALLKDKEGNSPFGRNNLIKRLKAESILQGNGIPYRDFINRGFFEVRTSVHNGIPFQSTLVFPKGIDYLAKRLGLIVDYQAA